jgi:hypothetical protein
MVQHFPRREYIRKINCLTSGRVWATALAFGVAVLLAGGPAMAQSRSKVMEDDMAQHKATIMDASKKMMEGSKMMQGGMMMKKEKSDAPEAEKAIQQGHKHVEEGAKKIIEPETTEKPK